MSHIRHAVGGGVARHPGAPFVTTVFRHAGGKVVGDGTLALRDVASRSA